LNSFLTFVLWRRFGVLKIPTYCEFYLESRKLFHIFATKSQYIVNIVQIGNAIEERRKFLGINQQTLADLAQVGLNTVVAIERGTGNPRLETLLKICETLGMDINIKVKD